MFDHKLDIIVAYAAAFGWNDQWGTPGHLRQDLHFMTEVLPHVLKQLAPMTPDKFWRWEFLRRVNRIPFDSTFYGAPLPYAFSELLLAFVPLLDLNQRAGGQVAQNIGRVYTLDEEDRSYLQNVLGVPPAELEAKLKQMNDQAIYTSDPNARNYAEHYYNPTGRITRPVLTLHTTGDPIVPVWHQALYTNKVLANNALSPYFSKTIQRYGHCSFTLDETVTAFGTLVAMSGGIPASLPVMQQSDAAAYKLGQ